MPSSNGQTQDKSASSGDVAVAATATAAKIPESKSWACHMCSYENLVSETAQQCEICSTPRLLTPPSAAGSSGQGDKSRKEWPCPKCTFLNAVNSTRCAVCNDRNPSSKTSSTKSQSFWHCPQCTFSNKSHASRCEICGYKKSDGSGDGKQDQAAAAAKITPKRLSTAAAAASEPPMLLPCKQESEFMEALRAIEESEAHEQYQRILLFCRQNRQAFVDDGFAPNELSLRRTQDNQARQLPQVRWQRPARIINFVDRFLFPWTVVNAPIPSDIVQGILGNCWFLSALAVVSERPDILEHILVTKRISPEGVYQIRLCVDGQWRVVVVDDLFPCSTGGTMIYSKAKRSQLWVPLIEKALAKVYGSYEALTAGRTIEGLAVLTGAPSDALYLPGHYNHADDSRESDPDVIWAQLLSMKEAKFLMGTSCGGDREDKIAEYHLLGLEPLHAYSLLDVREVNGARLVKCRNPWGHFSWNGAWSEHSSLWTPELLATLLPEGFRDGIFWMPYEDFCRYFDTVDVCRYRTNWRELRLAGLLPPHCRRNFIYVAELAVQEATEVDVALYQQNVRNEKPTKHGVLDLSVMIFSVDEFGRPSGLVARSDHAIRPFVTADAILQPGQYIMMWFAFNHWGMRLTDAEIPKCVVAVHSARALAAQVRSVNPIVSADCLIQMFLRDAKVTGTDVPGVTVYYLTKNWTGVAVMVANRNKDFILNVQCDCSESENAVSTRGVLATVDVIPPMHRQIVMVLSQVEGSAASRFTYRVQYTLVPTIRQQVMNYANKFFSFLGAQPPAAVVDPDYVAAISHVPELDLDVYGLHAPRPIV